MGIRAYRPYTPSTRQHTVSDFAEVTRSTPERSLVTFKHRQKGRNNRGVITCRHRGGGHRKLYRIIDFHRDKHNLPAKVAEIEYDPNRNARIALLHYSDGEKRYILHPAGLQVGTTIVSGPDAPIEVGNALPLIKIPLGTDVHNVELVPGKGGQMVRSAGANAQIMAKEGDYVTLKLPSGEQRKVLARCYATIGQVGNADFRNLSMGKAGRNRWLGKRPTVRGSVMNPVDHPMGWRGTGPHWAKWPYDTLGQTCLGSQDP